MNSVDTFFISHETDILCHQWGDESVIYLPVSGETHLMEAAAAEILLTIAAAPTCFEQLKVLLTATYQETSESEINDYLTNTLQELQNIDLVTTVRE